MSQDQSIPPKGDFEKAEKYIRSLVDLISQDKVLVSHTDLSKFDPTNLQDHFKVELPDHQIEISHNKQPNSGQDVYVMLFTNIQKLSQDPSLNAESCNEKVILAYTILNEQQFKRFRGVALEQIEKFRKIEEERKFNTALHPLDRALEEIASGPSIAPTPHPEAKTDAPKEELTQEVHSSPEETLSEESTTHYMPISEPDFASTPHQT